MSLVLSVEDTNKLRAQLGLKLIPVTEDANRKRKGNAPTAKDVQMQIRMSAPETNKLRAQLGVKLLADDANIDEESRNYMNLKEDERKHAKISQIKANLEEKKTQMKNSQRLEKGGILDRINEKEDLMDIDSWLDKVEGEVKKGNVKKLNFKKKDKKKSNDEENTVSQPAETIPIEGEILTAKDVNVLDDDVVEEEFEDKQLIREQDQKQSLQSKSNVGKLVSLDELEEPVQSTIVKLPLLDIDDQEVTNHDVDDNDSKKISNLFKRDISKFKKSKKSKTSEQRKRVFETELVEKEFTAVKLDLDEDENDLDNLDNILDAARTSKFKKRKFNYDSIDDGIKQSTETQIINENLDFLDNIQVEETDEIKPAEIEQHTETELKQDENSESKAASRYMTILDIENEKNYSSLGVSNILSQLKKSSTKNTEKTNKGEVDIVYTDDNGKVLNTKEAFKYLSHKFHGSKKN